MCIFLYIWIQINSLLIFCAPRRLFFLKFYEEFIIFDRIFAVNSIDVDFFALFLNVSILIPHILIHPTIVYRVFTPENFNQF